MVVSVSRLKKRLVGVGTIILIISSSSIILPILLTGKKNNNKTQYDIIPLVAKAEYSSEDDSDSKSITTTTANKTSSERTNTSTIGTKTKAKGTVTVAEEIGCKSNLNSNSNANDYLDFGDILPLSQPSDKANSNAKNEQSFLLLEPNNKINDRSRTGTSTSQHNSYVIQLGVLKNAAKVEEITAMLSLSGYIVYTDPIKPINGQLTRIFIGPNTLREKLQDSLSELKDLTGLQGQIRVYNPRSRSKAKVKVS